MVYIGNGIARNVLKIYAGDGVAREVAKGYIGDENNIARLAYSRAPAGLPIFNLPVGTLVSAPFDNTPTLIRLLNHGSPSSLYYGFDDAVIFMFENIIENRPWHGANLNDYANSGIHIYQNGDFLSRVGFANQLKQVRVPYRVGSSGSSIGSGINGLLVYMWLLGGREINMTTPTGIPADGTTLSYFSGTAATDAKRIARLNNSAATWWLRSADTAGNLRVLHVTTAGGNSWNINTIALSGFRPAFALPNTALVDPTPNPDGSYALLVA